jgi:hypothetical protein
MDRRIWCGKGASFNTPGSAAFLARLSTGFGEKGKK